MGQGYSATTIPAGPSAIEAPELIDLTFEKVLGGARFLRTVRAKHKNGVVVVKVCMKSSAAVSFKKYARILKAERTALSDVPNVLTYQRILETGNYGILVRQFIHNSLYDRISIRPFLEAVEKKWIAFQLICAVRDCHSRGIFHGDIKSENVLITSWGWVYLTDFSSAFKPVYLPEDNPADFSFYFDTAARRTCYLAPERFLAEPRKPGEDDTVQWNMDIFSLGCVIAELFTEAPTFTLTQLFKYRKGEYDPIVPLLSKIDDEHIRALIASMLRLDPGERWHAQDYLDEYKNKAFPLYFYQHLHTLMQEVTDPSSGRTPVVVRETNNAIADDRIERIYADFEMLSVSLGYNTSADQPARDQYGLFPLQIDLPNARHLAAAALALSGDNGTLILLNVVTSSVRNVARATSKIHACELLLAFAARLPDEAKLDRVLPYIMPLLEDNDEMVLVTALRTMTQLLALVTVTSPVNSFLFTQYIFPRLLVLVHTKQFKNYPVVRATYAACLATLAETASRFLGMIQALRADGSLPAQTAVDDDSTGLTPFDSYDATRADLVNEFEAQTKVFLTDNNTAVRRAFLSSVTSLCVFFGEAKAADVILSHLNTYLNDPNWQLKCDFFKTIVGISVYVGGASIEDFILPLMLQALTDPQDFVVEQALRSLASMAELGLLQRPKTWELIDTVARFTMHPNLWIREAAAHFVAAAIIFLSVADIRVLVTPLIAPYLKTPVATLSESEILDSLRKPLPRTVLDLAMSWATRVDRGVFWKSAKDSRRLSYHGTGQVPPQSSVADLTNAKSLARVPKNDEDEQYIGRLRSAGMHSEDEFKFLAFREYIWRVSHRRNTDDEHDAKDIYDDVVSIAKLKIRPHTVLFDNDPTSYGRHVQAAAAAQQLVEAPSDADNASPSLQPKSSAPLGLQNGKLTVGTLSKRPSDSLSSSPSPGGEQLSKEVDRALRHRESRATILLGKAAAEVATTDLQATGQLQRPAESASDQAPKRPSTLTQIASSRSIHNYDGSDPNVLKLLDNVYVDSFPVDVAEFGPIIQSNKRGDIPSSGGQQNPGLWRPQGRTVAVLNEHTSKISQLVVSPDHAFFLSASDDGTVKVWDSERLERNVSHRSRATHRLAAGVRLTSLCFVDSTHTFICAGNDGRLQVVKVDVTEAGPESTQSAKYGKLKVLREWQIPRSESALEYAVHMEHMRRDATNIVVLATNTNRVLAVDLRRMNVVFEFRNPAQHGSITTFCIGRKHDWLLIGTTHGVLDLWDIRFRLKLRSWAFPAAACITRLQLHPSRKAARRNRVCVAGGSNLGEVSVWDIEKVICIEVYRAVVPAAGDKINLRDYELRNLEDGRSDALLTRAGDTVDRVDTGTLSSYMAALLAQQPSPKDSETQLPFLITGGPDNKVRFWDPDHLEACKVVGGSGTDPKPSYTISTLNLDTKIISEKPADSPQPPAGAIESNKVGASTSARRGQSNSKTSRYDQIRLSAQHLLNGHLDSITDIALLERPFGMIVSSNRAGQIFIHQ
ncbi:hypothetical protein AMS68_004334 [Peltaster fructicola]|uniref:non-specific serine/threonine protein kinase n=1 Tax=Peltaster fructicola TaxID=286661 RepID=A0A6H0XVN4_9PEZI|nr:hypothetical protein AMS68_004334 [Peltaster fructicola]